MRSGDGASRELHIDTRDGRYSVLLLDLGMGVLPTPEGTAFSQADLMQFVPKYREFYNDTAAEEAAPVAGESFIPVLRRRRR